MKKYNIQLLVVPDDDITNSTSIQIDLTDDELYVIEKLADEINEEAYYTRGVSMLIREIETNKRIR